MPDLSWENGDLVWFDSNHFVETIAHKSLELTNVLAIVFVYLCICNPK